MCGRICLCVCMYIYGPYAEQGLPMNIIVKTYPKLPRIRKLNNLCTRICLSFLLVYCFMLSSFLIVVVGFRFLLLCIIFFYTIGRVRSGVGWVFVFVAVHNLLLFYYSSGGWSGVGGRGCLMLLFLFIPQVLYATTATQMCLAATLHALGTLLIWRSVWSMLQQ